MSEFVLIKKDIVRLNFLKEITDKSISMKLFLEADGKEKDINEIKQAGQTQYRFNNFNVIENSAENTITFNHNVIGCLLYLKISTNKKVSVDLIKKDTNTVSQTIEILPGETKITFNPNANKQYDITVEQLKSIQAAKGSVSDTNNAEIKPENMEFHSLPGFDTLNVLNVNKQKKSRISRPDATASNNVPDNTNASNNSASTQTISTTQPDIKPVKNQVNAQQVDNLQHQVNTLQGEISDMNAQIEKLNNQIKQLENNKKNLKNHLDKLQAEYDKNYKEFDAEAKKIAENYHIDAEILEMYKDKDIVPVEELLKKANDDNTQLENQIRVFVSAQERKIANIENIIKG